MSDVLHSELCRTDPDCEIRIKKAAWNEKYGTDDISVKFTWRRIGQKSAQVYSARRFRAAGLDLST